MGLPIVLPVCLAGYVRSRKRARPATPASGHFMSDNAEWLAIDTILGERNGRGHGDGPCRTSSPKLCPV